uniref:Uncharacterized protein n=1 Tax=Electrophorus electricus TaxID=8005 RepID=A0AAY5E8C1_ELEEL
MCLESRYGTCELRPSTKAEITLPSADSDRLIFAASFRRSPRAPVFALRPSGPGCPHSTVTVKMACDRELRSFMLVAPTERARSPAFITCSISATSKTKNHRQNELETTRRRATGCSISSR